MLGSVNQNHVIHVNVRSVPRQIWKHDRLAYMLYSACSYPRKMLNKSDYISFRVYSTYQIRFTLSKLPS